MQNKKWSHEKTVSLEQFSLMKEHYRDPENDGTYINKLYVDEFNNIWAIVMAWWDYDGNGKYEMYGKVAYQPTNSLMQEYGIDWLMPYDEEFGDVRDTQTSLSTEQDIDYLFEIWDALYKEITKKGKKSI